MRCTRFGRAWRKHIADVRDIVGGCVAALGNAAAVGQTFQLAGPAPFTWDEACEKFRRYTASVISADAATTIVDAVGGLEQVKDMAGVAGVVTRG